jgi:hypothetical protein
MVTFANGVTAREVIVDLDDERRRLVWSATGGRLTHHNAAAQVFAAMIDAGCAAMKKALERT